jgi:hypothetical protein
VHHEVSVVAASMVISVHVTEPKSHVASSCSSIVRIALPSQRYWPTSGSAAHIHTYYGIWYRIKYRCSTVGILTSDFRKGMQNLLAVVGSNSRLPLNGPCPAALPC